MNVSAVNVSKMQIVLWRTIKSELKELITNTIPQLPSQISDAAHLWIINSNFWIKK